MTDGTQASNRPLNPRRIGVIAFHTFTQLVRMKVFYFLAFFALILLGSNLFDIQGLGRPELDGTYVLQTIRSWSLGAMTLFSVVLAITATALLLPRDIEDRTLYTILAKPVPRLDYLVGKLSGVLLLVGASLLVMDLLMTGVLALRMNMVLDVQMAAAHQVGMPPDEMESLRADITALGPDWHLHGAVAAVFLRAAVLASLSLLISTFSTSTLFTIIVGVLFYFIGHFQSEAREFYLSAQEGAGPAIRGAALAVAVIFPDFTPYNVIDEVIGGAKFSPGDAMLVGTTAFYVVLHTFTSWLVFSKKEF